MQDAVDFFNRVLERDFHSKLLVAGHPPAAAERYYKEGGLLGNPISRQNCKKPVDVGRLRGKVGPSRNGP